MAILFIQFDCIRVTEVNRGANRSGLSCFLFFLWGRWLQWRQAVRVPLERDRITRTLTRIRNHFP